MTELARHLPAQDITPILVGPKRIAGASFPPGVEWIVTPPLAGSTIGRLYRLGFENVFLKSRLRLKGARLYHATAFRAPYRDPGVPVVTTIPDLAAFFLPDAQPRLRSAHLRAQVRRAVCCSRLLIVLSAAVREELLARFPLSPEKVRVIPLGASEVFRTARRFEPSVPTFVSVATLERRKNLLRLLDAFDRVRERYPAARLRLIGQTENDARRIRQRIDALGLEKAVTLDGYLGDPEVAAAYAHSTAVVYPSLYEGFGLPVLEAMAAGSLVIASNRGAMREVGGEHALLVDPEDPNAIAAAMLCAIEKPGLRDERIKRGRERALLLTWERCAALHAEVYREAAGG